MEKYIYMPVDSRNLANYYSSAVLKPSKYFQNRIEDVQSKFASFILLSEKKYALDSDCALEVVLTKEEQNLLVPLNTEARSYLFNNALPISRVRKIYFQSSVTKDKITTLVNMSSGFLPESFTAVDNDVDAADFSNVPIPNDLSSEDLSEKIRRYDSFLGGFALMRLSAEENMSYSENYFSTFSRFNKVIESELLNANVKVSDIFWDAFEGKDKFKILYPFINKKVTEDDLNEICRIEGQSIQKNRLSGKIDIDSLDKASYIIAIIYSYGLDNEGRRNKIDGLILNSFKKEIKAERAEVIALCYGLNRGYSAFSNKYRSDRTEKILKFELNSQIDYYLIETAYQYAFNKLEKSAEFPYIDAWCPKYPKLSRKLKKSEYLILDKVISTEIISVGSSKWWTSFMQFFFQKNSEELFRPLMVKIFDKIKQDIELEYSDELQQKNDEILALKIQNDKTKKQQQNVVALQNKIEALEKELDELKNSSDISDKITTNSETKLEIQEPSANYKNMLKDCHLILEEITNMTTSKKIIALIKKFNDRYPPEKNELL